ncbi:hypothetical protein Bcav_2617 [Beutenbergia cavernae DSM 12333]|uniref:CU044_5270 family protein n=1 Tax=Beutenbergia cavernae (strain ATCC BAA-8 / DSM 12333 / CCUG 43141 / JCM 11478 / NBRC 16432 / NCIMB 13614 / HKI 0122) TaxID=471853 RepID=C5BXH9_BEUC1|nr:CU044_5270 family protein [Beutenbergia cavernae]ACQ80862.1 hypothetical protein Bcav_2617 [Beutenbergia cavernae DSM 12333]
MTGTTMERAADAVAALQVEARRAGLAPAHTAPGRSESARDLARSIVRGEVAAPRMHRAPLTPRRLLPAMAVAAAAAVVAVVALQPPAPAQAGPPRLEFAEEGAELSPASGVAPQEDLSVLAAAADASSVPGPSAALTVQEIVTAGWGAQGDSEAEETAFVTSRTQVLTEADGAVTVRQERGEALTEDGRGIDASRAWIAPDAATDELPAGTIDPTLLQGLPSEPAALRARMAEALGCDDPALESPAACLAQSVEYLHTFTVVPADVEAGMWQVLAAEPGVVSLGGVEDRAGRAGIGIAVAAPGRGGDTTMTVLVGDPETGTLLGSEHLVVEPDEASAPRVVEFVTFLSRAWVAEGS